MNTKNGCIQITPSDLFEHKHYLGGKLGRKPGSVKSADQKKEEYKEAILLLKKGYAIRDVAKLTGKGVSTIQRVKKEFF